MLNKLLLFIALLMAFTANAQVFPANGTVINYRIFLAQFPALPGADNYTVEIRPYCISTGRTKTINLKSTTNQVRVEVPLFGTTYKWHYVAYKGNAKVFTSPEYSFITGNSHFVDNNQIKVTVKTPYTAGREFYFFSDRAHVLYGADGRPVWYLPEMPGHCDTNDQVRDLRMTPQGSITFLNGPVAIEANADGNVIWKHPDNNSKNSGAPLLVHHEFKKLTNGHYMVLGTETSNEYPTGGEPGPNRIPEGTVTELDKDHNVIWHWNSNAFYTPDKLIAATHRKILFESHENSFDFNEPGKYIYISFKHTNQVLKVQYPEGNVSAVFGGGNNDTTGNLPFCAQHSCKATLTGDMAVYNNNGCHKDGLPSLVVMNGKTLEKILDIVLPVGKPEPAGSGGNVVALNNNLFFISAGAPYGDIFMIDTKGKIQYHALLQIIPVGKDKWEPMAEYRATPVTEEEALKFLLHKHINN